MGYPPGKHPNSIKALQEHHHRGRPKGTPNVKRSTAERLRTAAGKKTLKALAVLVSIMEDATASPDARIRAAGMVLAYAVGRPRTQGEGVAGGYRSNEQVAYDMHDMRRAFHGEPPRTEQGMYLAQRFGLCDDDGQPYPDDDDDIPQA